MWQWIRRIAFALVILAIAFTFANLEAVFVASVAGTLSIMLRGGRRTWIKVALLSTWTVVFVLVGVGWAMAHDPRPAVQRRVNLGVYDLNCSTNPFLTYRFPRIAARSSHYISPP